METLIRFHESFQTCLMKGCLCALLLIPVVCLFCKTWPSIRAFLADSLHSAGVVATCVLVFCVSGFVQFGSTKNKNSYRADENIGLVGWEIQRVYGEPYTVIVDGESVTHSNIVSFAWQFYTTNNVAPNPIWYRASNASNWVNAVTTTTGWDAAQPYLTDYGTDGIYVWQLIQSDYDSFMNALQQTPSQWYIGVDKPAVEVKGDNLVKVREVRITSDYIDVAWEMSTDVDLAAKRVIMNGSLYSFSEAHLVIYIDGLGFNASCSFDDYDGSDMSARLDGFFVDELRTVYITLTLDNLVGIGGE